MVIMSLQALLAILMVFCVRIFLINCSINDRMFEPISTVKVIMEKDINADKMPINDVAGCSGILFCYPSKLSPNSEGNWKPSKAFELTKKGESKLCLNSEKEAKLGNVKNIEWHGVIVFKDGKNDVEIFADIFPQEFGFKLKVVLKFEKILERNIERALYFFYEFF
ncbi:unnamed protein product [Meloidogyne enterolobii]|uniref:Uncharacterized protein n=1 Tax=Meloidogyne enterolobii TaxID=390850 RepID=A0ACB0YY19_MELEN